MTLCQILKQVNMFRLGAMCLDDAKVFSHIVNAILVLLLLAPTL